MLLEEKVSAGKFVVLGEFQPPKGVDFEPLLAEANLVKGRIDALLIPDHPVAVMKASALGLCAFFENRGFSTVMAISPRDRNRLALQGDLLAAAALGVHNVLVHPGEDVTHGDHHLAREVHDLDVPTLLEAIAGLQGGKDMAGIDLDPAPCFFVGAEIAAGADDNLLDSEIARLNQYSQKGVRFVVTTPVFDLRKFAALIKRIDTDRIAVLPALLVLKSAGMARYVDRNVKNVSIPQDMIKRVEKAPDRERIGLNITGELIARIKDMGLPGAVVMTRGWEKRLPRILDHAGI